MATASKYSVSGNTTSPRVVLTVTESSYSIANNESTVSYNLKIERPYQIVSSASKDYSITINGSKVKSGTTTVGGSGTKTIASGTTTIKHNDDGKKTITFSFELDLDITWDGVSTGTVSASGSLKLTDIPRASSVTCNSFYIGDSTTINIARASDTFTHTIKYVYGYVSGTIAEKTTLTSIGWTPPTSFYAQIPNGTTGYGSVTCETYSGDTLIGTSTANFNAYAKQSDCIPSVSATIVDTKAEAIALTGDSSKIIKYISQPKVTVSATAKNSATIKTRSIAWGDGQVSYNTTDTFGSVEKPNVTVATTDSRGYSGSTAYNLSTLNRWIEYVKLAFASVGLSRQESTVSTAKVSLRGNYFNGSFGAVTNTLTLKYRYSVDGKYSDYVTVTPTISGNTFTYDAVINNIDYQKEYIFEFVLEDEAMVVSSGERKLEKGQAIFRIGQDYTRTNGRILDEYGTELVNGLSKYRTGGVDIDPNTTLEELILTETNTPSGFCYVRTMFYAKKTTTANRTQVAYPYSYDANTKKSLYTRTYVDSIGWSEWSSVGSEVNAEDYAGLFQSGKQLLESGWVTITPTGANTPTAVNVAFKKAYNKIPVVLPVASSGVIGTQVLGASVNGISKTSANIVLTRINTTPTTVYYYVLGEA